jgi:hypothetical protein
VIALIGVITVVAVLVLALTPLWARRQMSAHVSRYLRLRWVAPDTTSMIPRTPAQPDDHHESERLPDRYWTDLDDHQLTRLLRDSSP